MIPGCLFVAKTIDDVWFDEFFPVLYDFKGITCVENETVSSYFFNHITEKVIPMYPYLNLTSFKRPGGQ